MSYFNETPSEEWDLEGAVLAKIIEQDESFVSIERVFDSIRSDLGKVDNIVAKEWKKNWDKITRNYLLKRHSMASTSESRITAMPEHPIPSTSTSIILGAHKTRSNIDDSTKDTQSRKRKREETSARSSQESKESDESEFSLYTNITHNTEVDFGRMGPPFIRNDNNISRLCFLYRNKCIKEYKHFDDLAIIKKMALNHVYFADPGISSIPALSELFLTFGQNDSYVNLTNEDTTIVAEVNNILNIHDKENALSTLYTYLHTNNRSIAARIMVSLITAYDNAESVNRKDESVFIEKALNPFLNHIFPTGGTLIKDGHFTHLIDNADLKPDIKYSSRVGPRLQLDFLVFEIKSPKSIAEDDLFKISLELQHMINRMVQNNVDRPVVYGVVGKGFKYDIYKMELVAPFLYLMVKIRSFYLPRGTYDFAAALTAIPALLQLNRLTCNQVRRVCEEDLSVESEQLDWVRFPLVGLKK